MHIPGQHHEAVTQVVEDCVCQGRAIFFWDHEVEDAPCRIADDFESFLDMLEPFDASMIKPAPGQVMSARIDPDFLKQFGE